MAFSLYTLRVFETRLRGEQWEIRFESFTLAARLLYHISGGGDGHLPGRTMKFLSSASQFSFSNSQSAIKFLSNVANNSNLNLLSGRFSITLIGLHGYCDIPENELSRADTILPESFSIKDLGMLLTSFKLEILPGR